MNGSLGGGFYVFSELSNFGSLPGLAGGLPTINEKPPDLIVLDIMMPKMDGYEVLRQLRKSDAAKQIPVIFLTAKGQKKDVLKGMELGAKDYVVKPYIFADLHGKIEKLIGEKKD